MPARMWINHERMHQYLGNQNQTFGGVTLNIDPDQLDVNLGGTVSGGGGGGGHAAFRIAVAINANGTAEWFALGASGALLHAWQQPVGALTWSAIHNVGNSPVSITSNPAAAAQANGALAVFARDSAGRLRHAWQQAGSPNGWQWGTPLPGPG